MKTTHQPDIGSRLRALRQQQGWTLAQLSAATGITARQLQNYERGLHSPKVSTLYTILGVWGRSVPEFLRGASR